jgi:hypothetical protein
VMLLHTGARQHCLDWSPATLSAESTASLGSTPHHM